MRNGVNEETQRNLDGNPVQPDYREKGSVK